MPSNRLHNFGIGTWLACLLVGVGLTSASCTDAGHTGQLQVNSRFFGRVPARGHLKLGAVDSQGRTLLAGTIGAKATKILTLPAGKYTVAVWLPDANQLTGSFELCKVRATVTAGQTSTVTLSCHWH
jgi:hypothetical protein